MQVPISNPRSRASIQAAVGAAGSGDEILVAPGTYREAIDFLGKAIHLSGTACLYCARKGQGHTVEMHYFASVPVPFTAGRILKPCVKACPWIRWK